MPNTIEVFYVAPDGSVQDKNYYDRIGWNGFQRVGRGGAPSTGEIAAVSRILNAIEIWSAGSDGAIQDRYYYDGIGWNGFELAR